jgi:hypothetical protein
LQWVLSWSRGPGYFWFSVAWDFISVVGGALEFSLPSGGLVHFGSVGPGALPFYNFGSFGFPLIGEHWPF